LSLNQVEEPVLEALMEPGTTIRQALPWLKRLLDYTDAVCTGITEDSGAVRPVDPAGGYCFSVKELLLHIADSRWQALGWLAGGSEQELFHKEQFCVKYGGTTGPWEFRAASVAEAQQCLREVRARLDAWLDQPVAEMLETTESQWQAFRAFLERKRAEGVDVSEFETGTPGCIADTLLFLAGHEQAHRAQLQLILRTQGQAVVRLA
jgi:hypothetical protein